jgi:tetratricopeptide (TPR) repeat protein
VRAEYLLWQGDCIHNDREGRTNSYLEASNSIKLGRDEEALESYDRVISLKPTYQPVYYDKATIYALQGNIEQALDNLREGVLLLATWRASGSVSNYAIASAQEPAFNSVRELPEFQALMQEAEASYQKIFGTPAGFYPDYPSAE